MEREVGGGIRMGNTCKPMAVSFQCMTKFTTNKKKIKKYSKLLLQKVTSTGFRTSVSEVSQNNQHQNNLYAKEP